MIATLIIAALVGFMLYMLADASNAVRVLDGKSTTIGHDVKFWCYRIIMLFVLTPLVVCFHTQQAAQWLADFIGRVCRGARWSVAVVRACDRVERWLRDTFGEVEGDL